jgi:hypothetical protein
VLDSDDVGHGLRGGPCQGFDVHCGICGRAGMAAGLVLPIRPDTLGREEKKSETVFMCEGRLSWCRQC